MGLEGERAARAKGTTRLDLGGARRDPGPRAGDTSESFERSIAALSAELSAHFAKARPGPPARSPALAAAGPAAPDLGLTRRADTLLRQDRPEGQRREAPRPERQRRQAEEKAGRLRGYAFALPLVSGIGAAAAVACSFYFLSGTGTVTPPPSPPRTTAATAPRLPPPSPPALGIVEPAPAAVAPPPKTAPAAPVESKAVESKAVAPAPAKDTPGKDLLSRNEILELQMRLKAMGMNPGPMDGVAGPQTAAAVRRYEESRGRPTTGFVDRDLLIRLQQEPSSRTTSR